MQDVCDSWSARPTNRLLERIHSLDEEGSARWIAVLKSTSGTIRIALGDPVNTHEFNLYVPQWILDTVGMNGLGEKVSVTFERSETLEKAQKLGFKVIGEIPEGIELKDLLEGALSELGVLEEGQIIPAPVLEGVHLILQTCEPGGAVFLDGAEVALEIEEDDGVLARRAEEKAQAEAEAEAKAQAEAKAEAEAKAQPRGRSKFIPFQGTGHRLCD